MNSCARCGEKLSHNYLVPTFTIINEKSERLIVCLKCREILNKKENKTRDSHILASASLAQERVLGQVK